MNKPFKQLLAFLCSAVFVLGCFGFATTAFGGEAHPTTGDETGVQNQPYSYGSSSQASRSPTNSETSLFYSVAIEKTDNSADETFSTGESVVVRMRFRANSMQAGTTVVVTLPDELIVLSAPDFALKNANGVSIASAAIDASSNSIIILFNDNVAGLGNISGQLTYTAEIASVEEGAYNLNFKEDHNETLSAWINIEKGAATDYDKPLHKQSALQADGSVVWTIYVNFDQQKLTNAVVTDVLDEGHALVDGEITIYRYHGLLVRGNRFDYSDRVDATDAFDIEYTSDGFRVVLGDISEGYAIICKSTITDPSVKNYRNAAYFTRDEYDSYYYWWNSVYWNYDGSATGDHSGKLKLIKRDFESAAPLPDAHFDLLDAQDNLIAQLITDASGTATVENLELGASYYLVETQPPAGYEVASASIPVTILDREELELVITNRQSADLTDPDPDPKPDPEPDPEPGQKPSPDPDPEPDPDPVPDLDPEPAPDPKPDPIPQPDPEPESKAGNRTGSTSSSGGTDKPDTQRASSLGPSIFDQPEMAPVSEANKAEEPPTAGQGNADTQNPDTGRISSALYLVVALVSLSGAALLMQYKDS